ncbi:MAG: hypothetical protein UX03_C0040G0011 [Candidatus Woesebacteria bacterium GW2011_GWE1_45_18]|uniref:Uncharacterized protein n=2 Tax=Candidatus Woeseibacteriota TaxID=1752722 RepID=A0A0G1PYK1_9BACT|nr:MAG: hypothetical protein UX03_C0040G0011 [Candidatus Woesebacteria bacterium GW2011_GWE1_45_18]OGM77948.1 MAG: hypothetical protein A2197_00355 [Candidatus Woesebacteria bacterium RIFOXYA1_FULL_48_16]
MSPDIEPSRVKRIRNDFLNGGVSAGQEVERAEAMLDIVFGPGRHLLVIDTSDFYPEGPDVSIEEAAAKQTRLQEAIDQEIVSENLGDSPVKNGLPPCLRVKKTS